MTDWSGIALEYFMIKKKPIIFIDTKKKILNKKYNEKTYKTPLEVSIRNKIGLIVNHSDLGNINYYIISG